MSIVVELLADEELPTGDTADVVLRYGIRATAGEFGTSRSNSQRGNLARTELLSQCLSFYDGREISNATVIYRGPNNYEGVVTYTARDWEYQFEVTTADVLVTRSLETIHNVARSGLAAANFNRLIGVTREGVEGTSVKIPIASWSETHLFDASFVTDSYRQTMRRLVGKMNQASFRGRDRGEVLFAGATGGIARGSSKYKINFSFLESENVESLNIDGITIPDKLGWDYLWTYSIEYPDTSAGRLVRRIIQANVERVIQFGDFGQLQLPA